MILIVISYLIILALLDRFVASNRGYVQPLRAPSRRKRSFYGDMGEQPEGEQEVMVRITNLQKPYENKVHAVRGVSEELYRGEIVSLLGENGAGKSTLINILIGVTSESKGAISVLGLDAKEDLVEIRKMCGVCPQFDILWE